MASRRRRRMFTEDPPEPEAVVQPKPEPRAKKTAPPAARVGQTAQASERGAAEQVEEGAWQTARAN